MSPFASMAKMPGLAKAGSERKFRHDLPPSVVSDAPLLVPIHRDVLFGEMWETELLGGSEEIMPCALLESGDSAILGLEG